MAIPVSRAHGRTRTKRTLERPILAGTTKMAQLQSFSISLFQQVLPLMPSVLQRRGLTEAQRRSLAHRTIRLSATPLHLAGAWKVMEGWEKERDGWESGSFHQRWTVWSGWSQRVQQDLLCSQVLFSPLITELWISGHRLTTSRLSGLILENGPRTLEIYCHSERYLLAGDCLKFARIQDIYMNLKEDMIFKSNTYHW